ncbi:glycosyltransferase family 2 protein [Bifidobacterium dentium]|uniref:glycosyltransferase family 2 protein n=1 Tax=Bifidobacterium dentium TaxID=1689 RepID=UPI0018B07115|nr:glycosyltransferase family 2 protein [Bifidobacterium dentium]MBF9667993.1 glycosyltransferase family 2 protein [Bifidobacterium dentium]
MTDKLVSIVVATYNAQETIESTFLSIANQTYPYFEVIVIDDGSTDATASICDMWASSDCRFRVFHRSNMGSAAARNFGIGISSGEYLLFIDSDDLVDSKFVETMLNSAIKIDAQIVFCNHVDEFFPNNSHLSRVVYEPQGVYFCSISASDFKSRALMLMNNGYWHTAWNKMYNTEFVRRIGSLFNESISVSEDTFFITPLYENAERVVCLKDVLYRYRIRGSSLSHSFSPTLFEDVKKAFMFEESESVNWPSDCLYFFSSDFLHYIELFFTPFFIRDGDAKEIRNDIITDEVVQRVTAISCKTNLRNRILSFFLRMKATFLLRIYGTFIFVCKKMKTIMRSIVV